MTLQLLVLAIALFFLIYGIIKAVKNKALSPLEKTVWITVMVLLPILGTMTYIRTMFTPRN